MGNKQFLHVYICFQLTIDPEYHPKIIGKRGAVINKIRQDHNVQINFPRRDEGAENIITITGYQAAAEAARDDIMKIVNQLVSISHLVIIVLVCVLMHLILFDIFLFIVFL